MKKKLFFMVIGLLLVGFSILFIYLYLIDDKHIQKKENDEEKISVNDNLILDLYNRAKFSGSSLSYQFYDFYFHSENSVTLDNISNEAKLWMAYSGLTSNDIKVEKGKNIEIRYFSLETLDEKIKEVFGKNIEYTKDKFMPGNCDCIYNYDKEEKRYSCIVSACEGPVLEYVDTYLEKAVKRDNKIEIYEKFVYFNLNVSDDINSVAPGMYKDVRAQTLITEIIDSDSFFINYKIKKYLSKLSTVKYTFESDQNGRYHFISSEIIK